MKKLVFMFVACATMSLAVSFSSCGGAEKAADTTDSVDSVAKADSAAQAEAAPADSDTTATEVAPEVEDTVAA